QARQARRGGTAMNGASVNEGGMNEGYVNENFVNEGCVLEAREIVKSFGSTPALRGASVAVGRGEILAVMGPSGSGKSTLLHCLAGILVPDSGQVLFGGQRL